MIRQTVMFLALATFPLLLVADVLTHEARVLNVEPLTVSRSTNILPSACYRQKPTDFSALLSWDIGCSQPQQTKETVYRVDYEMHGQRLSTTLDSRPGATLPVRVGWRVDAD